MMIAPSRQHVSQKSAPKSNEGKNLCEFIQKELQSSLQTAVGQFMEKAKSQTVDEQITKIFSDEKFKYMMDSMK